MDSLPTASTQSWFIVAAVAFSPVMVLFLADAIGWLFRQARGKGGVTTVGLSEFRNRSTKVVLGAEPSIALQLAITPAPLDPRARCLTAYAPDD
jgi:hypothetical protein